MRDKVVEVIKRVVGHKLSVVWLAVISFAEASFFPIPPDLFLMPMVALRRAKWLAYGMITTLYSVAGGMFGYLIGVFLFEKVASPLINFYGLQDQIAQVAILFQEHTFGAVFISAFTPIPYKVFTIASGMFDVQIITFIVAAFLGRGIRFTLEAWFMKKFGESIAKSFYKSFNTISGLLVVVVLVLIVFITKH